MKTTLKRMAGCAAHTLLPDLAREVREGRLDGPHLRMRQWIADHQTRRAATRGDEARLRRNLTHYWTSHRGDAFYDAYPDRFERWFLGEHFAIVEELERILRRRSEIRTLVELGCGDGRVLAYLADRFSSLESFTGLDINPGIIRRNRRVHADRPGLRFECSDLTPWLNENLGPGSLVFSYGGVLEYLPESELRSLFATIRSSASPSVLALVEPIAPDFDPERETRSRPYGPESSLSHPHRHFLEEAGWEIAFEQSQHGEHHWMLLVAVAKPAAPESTVAKS